MMDSVSVSISTVSGRAALRFEADFPLTVQQDSEEITGQDWEIQLPTWRPGRYELGNFAQYILKMVGVDPIGNEVVLQKVNLHRWKVPAGISKIVWDFQADILNAGSTYISTDLQYVNPVNCFIYDPTREYLPYIIYLSDIPENWDIATALPKEGTTLFAANMQHLMDSPWMASPKLWHTEYQVVDEEKVVDFHVWSYGLEPPKKERFIQDHIDFSKSQIKYFGTFPTPFYHFLYILPAEREVRHGVEHEDSTVIALGPADKINSDFGYDELVAIASHELYHSWNVKRIRPAEWMPYDFTKACPSRLGYIAEGVTTYMGDLFLFKAGCIDIKGWCMKMEGLISRHLNNPGRHNLSVADSSYDTWLDGYRPGVKGRKGSIYVEGAICAFICDVRIMTETDNKSSLSTAMSILWERFGKSKKGLTADEYWSVLAEVAGTSLDGLRKKYADGTCDTWEDLVLSMKANGIELTRTVDEKGITTPILTPLP
tara:strand:+ start:2519 stop:3976 length:1458 start_codon:yes stop_codon:yes gene_type:complete